MGTRPPIILPLQKTSPEQVWKAATRAIQDHGVLALPTESYYALAASAFDPIAVSRVCALKGRPEGKPILVLIGERVHVDQLVATVPRASQVLMDRFWPGPLTLIFPARPGLPDDLTAGTHSIGIRQVALPLLIPLLRQTGPLTGTSANYSGQKPPRTPDEIDSALRGQVDLLLDGGHTPGGPPSTLVDTREPVRLVREGPISREAISAALTAAGIHLSS